MNERGLTSTQWSVYNTDTKCVRYSSVPTSTITAEAVMVDGFAVSQKDTSGIVTTATRRYTAAGIGPTQQPGKRLDCIPPSRPHYPCKGNHLHSWVFVTHQNPITCQCYEKKEETVTCL